MDLDGFVYNARHCSVLTESDCTEVPEGWDVDWDLLCVPCEEPYDWSKDYNWVDGMLADGEDIRPVDNATVVNDRIETEDGLGELDIYYIPSHGEDPTKADTTILYSHGNFANIEHYQPRVRLLHEAGYHVIVWDYRGYGKSEPAQTATSEQFLSDAIQVQQWALTQAPDASKIVLYGISLGAIPAIEMATRGTQPCALFLEVPFTSMNQIAEANTGASLGEGFLSQGNYNNRGKLEGYRDPLLVMHGSNDNLFPLDDVKELYDGAIGPKEMWIVEGGEHGIGKGVPERGGFGEYTRRMSAFLENNASSCLDR